MPHVRRDMGETLNARQRVLAEVVFRGQFPRG
jgi:hypothetical protein